MAHTSKVILFFLDAFSSRYLEKARFLHELSKKCFFASLKPIFAFKGIGKSVLTGTRVNTHGVWSDFALKCSEEHRTYRSSRVLRLFQKMSDRIPNDYLRRDSRYVLTRFLTKNRSSPNAVPLDVIDFFTAADEGKSIRQITLKEQLEWHEKEYYETNMFEHFEKLQVKNIIKNIRNKDFIFVRFNSLDRVGHRYGPESSVLYKKIAELDHILQVLINELEKQIKWHAILFSDHGMSPVRRTIDLLGVLENLEKFEMPKDYLLFLHSTAACFWFRNAKAREAVENELSQVRFGFVLDKAKLRRLGIDKIGYRYGELIFALEEGNVFFPDYYWRVRPPKGMHGYTCPSYDNPVLLIHSVLLREHFVRTKTVEHIDIMPTILDLLNLPKPTTCEGTSIVARRTALHRSASL